MRMNRFVVVFAVIAFTGACGASPSGSGPEVSAAAPPSGGSSARKVVYANYGGSTGEAERKAWIEPCSQQTGITVIEDSGSDAAKLKAMVEANTVTWDIVNTDPNVGLETQSWFEELDFTKIPRDELISTTKYRASNNVYGTVLGYNTTTTGDLVPQTWADFFDTVRFPGKRGVWDYAPGGVLEIALMADGVAPADLYPLDIDRALAKLGTIKDDLVFWTSGAEAQDLLASGEVTMAMIWNGRAWNAKHTDNAPVEVQWHGQILGIGYFVVPKGAPNKDAAMDLLGCILSKEINGRESEFIPSAPGNTKATPSAENPDDLPTSHLDLPYVQPDDAWLDANAAEIDSKYQAWKTE